MFAIYSLHFGSLAPFSVCFLFATLSAPAAIKQSERKKNAERAKEGRANELEIAKKRRKRKKPAEAVANTTDGHRISVIGESEIHSLPN